MMETETSTDGQIVIQTETAMKEHIIMLAEIATEGQIMT